METTEKLQIGQIVKSSAGRDSSKIFVIIEILDENYVLLVDGDLRKLDNPKKKKVKHLRPTNRVLDEIKNKIEAKEKFNNAYVRKLLASFRKEN
ncbi:KOW domain-containing RNA-binding protein [Clostridium sp. D2Q-11]|uniref:KOW domain-containing RNA-binding protein n=1 Tax=Anaeromonas frigoriresistens TaxID=2683708 RepID=A0A942UQH7_9FIRM|nr:KOW domain-containing RNA-binding protein [Anaeromonas frigoriresistens]MBS4537333.1 KOW domain-containing RNA-binding protein [Anaeromonas frigoriresistens]